MGFFGWVATIVITLAVAWLIDWLIDNIGGGGKSPIDQLHDEVHKF